MEIKAILQKSYTENERINFIVQYNHVLGYIIEETDTELQAWGYTEDEIALQEKERIAKLSLTKREVFLGLYQAKGVTPDMIKAQLTDPQALIEFEYANDYYRGNPLIDIVGATLGITPEQLDCFFETKDYTCLLPIEEEEVIDDTNNSTTTDDTDVPVQPQIEDGLQEGETTDG